MSNNEKLPDGWSSRIMPDGSRAIFDPLTTNFLESTGPDPKQKDLDELFGRTTRVRILEDGAAEGRALGKKVLLETQDASAISGLHDALKIRRENAGHCMCHGDHAIEFFADKDLITTIGVHHGFSIRWSAWRPDGGLKVPGEVYIWMSAHGVKGPLRKFEEDQREGLKIQEKAAAWKSAAPTSLQSLPAAFSPFGTDPVPLEMALQKEYPDPIRRAVALMVWYGTPKSPWSGFSSYETIPESLLIRMPMDVLIAAASSAEGGDNLLEGAARLFAGSEFGKKRTADLNRLPPELKEKLLRHCLASGDDYRHRRAKAAFR